MISSATISPDQLYRYSLSREWATDLKRVCFVMLNPSTADGHADDPTLRKCIGFASRLGFGSLTVVNLFAYRATDPAALRHAPDPVGPLNNDYILRGVKDASLVICAWGGSSKQIIARARQVLEGPLALLDLRALRVSEKTGQPGHPLYLPYELQPKKFGQNV